ncbi:MAG: 30S ribosomal protein S12 methylthiotransferase RimO [Desulfobulbaceae bacterium]|jgi:ribosomal protein S12 methylthiotransferase|nr:30S ribosomal protein S12 methylthiotransferase RimO [Desulfobulbaceae bacterium]
MNTIHLVSLGCAKNLVDSQRVLGALAAAGFQPASEAATANVLLVNTCGFLQAAVEEGIDEILRLATDKQLGQKLVVFGCLVERYGEELVRELPEVDLFRGVEPYAAIAAEIQALLSGATPGRLILGNKSAITACQPPRLLTAPRHRAYLKITEGCDNRCSYCMIPAIRGPLRSRPLDELTREAMWLEQEGIQELSLIAQDLTAYGRDHTGRPELVELLTTLTRQTAIPWIRLLYLHPLGVTENLLECIAAERRLLPYLDIPIQHASSRILKAMNRRYDRAFIEKMVSTIRAFLPDVSLRTTLLVGFPGEEERDVDEVITLLEKARFDHVGVFAYSNEPGAPSEHFPGQCPEEEKERRRDRVMAAQANISAARQKNYIGRSLDVLVEGVSAESELLLEGRSMYQAPEVDGCVYINEGTAAPGDIVRVRIEEAHTYDLVGGMV